MFVLAAHKYQHTLPTFLGLLALLGSIGLGVGLVAALNGKSHRLMTALVALSLATMSVAWLKGESDTWWKRRCQRTGIDGVHYTKPGCGTTPPRVPFMVSPSD